MFMGSEGTLGVITAATLRLHARPEEVGVAVCAFDSIMHAVVAVVQTMQYSIPVARIGSLLDKMWQDVPFTEIWAPFSGWEGISFPQTVYNSIVSVDSKV